MHNLIHARLIAALFAATLFLPAAVPAAEAPVDLEPQRLIAPEVIAQRDFALHLASALGVRIPDRDDPAAAVRALEERGIAPRTGWEPDEAVTPQTIAELRAHDLAQDRDTGLRGGVAGAAGIRGQRRD